METFFYQAECGDAARIRYIGSDGKPHNIFIDSGSERTYKHILREEIIAIRNAGEVIDLWIVSHIHDDHIGGTLSYAKAVKNHIDIDIVQNWYYNPPRLSLGPTGSASTFEVSQAKSIVQGDLLAEYLLSKKKLPLNDITNNVSAKVIYGLKITILSPGINELELLRNKYASNEKALEQNEITAISSAKSAGENDYHIPALDFELNNYREDDSIENGSSIAVLTEYQNCKTLWLADSHPKVIANKLKGLGYSESKPLVCDWVKVAHHGSKGNNSDELYDLIRCNNYLISANGINKHNLPNKECLVRILRNKNRLLNSHYKFVFTYDNHFLRSMFSIDGERIFEQLKFSVTFLLENRKILAV